jgi:hypothetical protein
MPSCYKQDKLRVESLAAVNEKGRRLVWDGRQPGSQSLEWSELVGEWVS